MSEPEKLYTLPEVLEIVKEHAGALFGAGAALEATEGEDPEMLAMVGERAERAQKQFWEFESENVLDEAAHAAWHERDENGEVSPLWHTLYALPLLPMGVEATAANPAGAIPGSAARFFWLHYHTERIAGVLMDWVDAHRKDLEPATATEENGVGAQPVSEPEEPQEPTKPESEQLMPTEAFEAMADALRPLAHGVRPLIAGVDELSGCYIDQSSKPWKLTQQGEYLLTDLANDAKKGLERLDHIDGGMLHRYMPDWCRTQLDDIREIVDRAAWMLWAGSEAANRQGDVCSDPPGSPHLTASLVYDMVKPAYRELCAKFDEYQAAEKPAIDKQYEVHGLHQAAERGVAPHAGDAQRDGGVPMTAEIIRLPVGIPGIGRAGDCVVHDPDHTDPRFRLSNVHPLDLDHLAEIKEKVREWEEAAKRKEVVS